MNSLPQGRNAEMFGNQQRGLQTRSMSRNKKSAKASTSEQLIMILPFIQLLNQHRVRLHGPDRPRGRAREAECRLIPLEKRVVEKKVSRGKIPRITDSANSKREFFKEMRIWLPGQPKWKS